MPLKGLNSFRVLIGVEVHIQALTNYLQCSRVSDQDLDYDSVLSVFDSCLNYISTHLGDVLTKIEASEMGAVTG